MISKPAKQFTTKEITISNKKDTHKLTVRVCQGKEYVLTAQSFQEALTMYDAVCEQLPMKPFGYSVERIIDHIN